MKDGLLIKIAQNLYTSNRLDFPEHIVARHLYTILGKLFPKAILSFRSAIEIGPAKGGFIVLTYKYNRKVELPGFTVYLVEGPKAEPNDNPFMENLFLASTPRALLENMKQSRKKQCKTLPAKEMEKYLEKICQINGTEKLKELRDEARKLAKILNMPSEFKKLDQLIGALCGTRSDHKLTTDLALARAKGIPYDEKRIQLFVSVATELCKKILPERIDNTFTPDSLTNLAFFEAYFSNYIEGTTFQISEAEDIIFHNKIIPHRSTDTHDVLNTFHIVCNSVEMSKIPQSSDELISILKNRHATILSKRKEKLPGEFKSAYNRAGSTHFVLPELVIGTLKEAFKIYDSLPSGLARAIFIMFIITEIHPFTDGNGRLARIMMNAELVSTGQCRIIIPTVFREDYLLALKKLSRTNNPDAYIKMVDKAQLFTSSIDFSEYKLARKMLIDSNAFLEPYEGKLRISKI